MVKFLTLAEIGEQIIKDSNQLALIPKIASSLVQCIELAPDKAAADVKQIPGINDAIEEEDENESQSDGREKEDTGILANLSALQKKVEDKKHGKHDKKLVKAMLNVPILAEYGSYANFYISLTDRVIETRKETLMQIDSEE